MELVGVAWTWWLTFGWTQGYDAETVIFWAGPVGFIFWEPE